MNSTQLEYHILDCAKDIEEFKKHRNNKTLNQWIKEKRSKPLIELINAIWGENE